MLPPKPPAPAKTAPGGRGVLLCAQSPCLPNLHLSHPQSHLQLLLEQPENCSSQVTVSLVKVVHPLLYDSTPVKGLEENFLPGISVCPICAGKHTKYEATIWGGGRDLARALR